MKNTRKLWWKKSQTSNKMKGLFHVHPCSSWLNIVKVPALSKLLYRPSHPNQDSKKLFCGYQQTDSKFKQKDKRSKTAWYYERRASLAAQRLKHLPAMQETWVRSLGQEDPLDKEMATHSNILAWRIPWRKEPGRLQSMGSQRVGHDWATSLSLSWKNNKIRGLTLTSDSLHISN